MQRFKLKFQLCIIFYFILCVSCTENTKQVVTIKEKYQMHCGSCHLAPKPADIPKSIWVNSVLPEMGGRMGYRYNNFNPTLGKSFDEKYQILKSKIYPSKPIIDSISWWEIHDYIISLAPDSIATKNESNSEPLEIFSPKPIVLDNTVNPLITGVNFDSNSNSFYIGSGNGNVHQWSPQKNNLIETFSSPITSVITKNGFELTTEIGLMNPSELTEGIIHFKKENTINVVGNQLHRPVYTDAIDLNNDGNQEVVVCEFGHLTGELSLFTESPEGFKKRTLLALPGGIKFEIEDINKDGKKDIVVLISQGNEGIFILYQKDDLKFDIKQVIKLPPHYGSSWFEFLDYNSDGHKDIILANGDNADYSIFAKPYHGVRLFINDTNNNFEEKWFYPINGATKVLTADYDGDGDLDFVISAFFADIADSTNEGFYYLENQNSIGYEFKEYVFEEPIAGNWLAMDKGDVDKDGDLDIVIGSFKIPTYNAPPADPKKSVNTKLWFLENNTIH